MFNLKKGEKMKTRLALIATSGDMSKNGIGSKNTVVPFDSAYLKEVKQFLRDQLELHSVNDNFESKENAKKFRKIYDNLRNSFNKLISLNIMEDKYDFRSGWELTFNDHDELRSYGNYQIREVA